MPANPIDILVPLLNHPPNLSALEDPAAWAAIKEFAGRYGVAPLIAYAARSHVSTVERAWCDRVLTESWIRYQRMLGHLEYLLGLLAAEGIPAIALKGPLLAQRYYTPPFLRKPSLDIDLAVTEANLERACHVLADIGYKPGMPIADATAQTHHVELFHSSKPAVELHFRLSHRALGIPVDEFFRRAVPFRLPNGREALVLAPADQLLHLVLHLAQSRFGTLFHLCEIRRICKAESVEVRAEAVNRAVEHHYSGAFHLLDIAFRLHWDEPFIPPGLHVPETWLNWRLTPKLYNAFQLWSVPGRGLTLPARLHARWLDFQLTDGPADALRLAAFFFKTAAFYITEKRAWGTPRILRFAPVQSPGPGSGK